MRFIHHTTLLTSLLVSGSVFAIHHLKSPFTHKSMLYNALNSHKKIQTTPFHKYGINPLFSTGMKDEFKDYAKNFQFDIYNRQYNRRFASREVNIAYKLNSLFFTAMKLGITRHIHNRNNTGIEPSFGLGIYLNKQKEKPIKLVKKALLHHHNLR